MARFYAKFDSQSFNPLDVDYFDRRRISLGSSSAALLRDGLIASRSAVSADVYDDLDVSNRLWSNGTYFPPDQQTFPTATLTSWSTAYSSSVPGIASYVANNNTYGGVAEVNYSLRPTASVTSTMNTLVGPESPLDPVQLSYQTYVTASNAVKTVLDSIQTGAPTPVAQTPYTRPGNIPSRTLHSIWHDPTMSYFAWDDFTPGAPNNLSLSLVGGILSPCVSFTRTGSLTLQFKKEYANDFNPLGSMSLQVTYSQVGTNPGQVSPDVDWYYNVIPIQDTTTVDSNTKSFRWESTAFESSGVNYDTIAYTVQITSSFYDAKITGSRGATGSLYNDTVISGFIGCGPPGPPPTPSPGPPSPPQV